MCVYAYIFLKYFARMGRISIIMNTFYCWFSIKYVYRIKNKYVYVFFQLFSILHIYAIHIFILRTEIHPYDCLPEWVEFKLL